MKHISVINYMDDIYRWWLCLLFPYICPVVKQCWMKQLPGGRLNIKIPSYQYRDSHVKDEMVSPTVLSLTWESPYLGKTVFISRWGPDSLCMMPAFLPPLVNRHHHAIEQYMYLISCKARRVGFLLPWLLLINIWSGQRHSLRHSH